MHTKVDLEILYTLSKEDAKISLKKVFYNDDFKNSKISIYMLLLENNHLANNTILNTLLNKMINCNVNLEADLLLELYLKVEDDIETKQKIKQLFSFTNYGNTDILTFFDSFNINNKKSIIELVEPFNNKLKFIIELKNKYDVIEEFKPEETNVLIQNKIHEHIPTTNT